MAPTQIEKRFGRLDTKLYLDGDRISNRVAGAPDPHLPIIQLGISNDHAVFFSQRGLGQIAPTLEELDEVDPSDLRELKIWSDWASRRRASPPRHPMIAYYEGVMDRYDAARAADKLRRFIDAAKGVQASPDTEDDDW